MLACALVVAVVASGCGGPPRQDENAPSGTWQVAVEKWEFPKHQYLGTPAEYLLTVRNTDTRAIPNLIVTVSGLKTKVDQPGAASEVRPIWIASKVNYANVTPYNSSLSSSWNMGELKPGAVVTYKVNLTPLRRGVHEVGYRLSADLFGDNKVVNGNDQSPAEDTRWVLIDPTPQFDEKIFKD